jgi:hypothetical protein
MFTAPPHPAYCTAWPRSWSNDLAGWAGATPMNNDERQLIQVKMIKDDSETADYTKVWIYRNMVYAYPWFTQVRKILDDPAYAPWFMMFSGKGNYTSPDCDHDCESSQRECCRARLSLHLSYDECAPPVVPARRRPSAVHEVLPHPDGYAEAKRHLLEERRRSKRRLRPLYDQGSWHGLRLWHEALRIL